MVFQKSLSTKLIIKIVIIVSILSVFTLICVSFAMRAVITKEAIKSAENAIQASVTDIEKDLDNVENITLNYACLAVEHPDNTSFWKDITVKMVSNNPYIFGCTIARVVKDAKGSGKFSPYSHQVPGGQILQHNLEDKYNYWDSEWYTIPLTTGKAVWSEPYFDDGGGDCWMSTYSYPVKDSLGNIFAIITADISLEWIKIRTEKIRPYENSFATMISKDGYFLSQNADSPQNTKTVADLTKMMNNKDITRLTQEMMAGKSGNIIFFKDGKRYISVYSPLKNGWSISITTEYADIISDIKKMNLFLLFIGIIGLVIMIIVCKRTIMHITLPLTEFSVSAMNMAKGNFKAQLPEVKSEDEMLRLHNSLEYMQKTINTYITELRTTTSNNERMESELYIARAIQLGMLPKDFPDSDQCHVHAMMVPAKEVGGDLYDFTIDKGYLYFTVGDVSGKGVPASLFMAIILSSLRFLYKFDFSMKERIELINQNMSHKNETGMFCTFFSARINLTTKKMEYCNAGHNSIIIIPADPKEKPYYHNASPNLALGLIEDFCYEEESLNLSPGTRLLLYTDGVDEAETIKKEQFGDDRLLEVVSSDEFRRLDVRGMVNAIYTTVKKFTSNIEANDDITLLVVEI